MLLLTKHKPLLQNQVHLWYLNLSAQLNNLPFYKTLLSDDEKERANKFRFKKDQNQFVISRGMLRVLSTHYLSMNAENIVFKYGTFGKPDYDFETALKFNISHSADLVIISFVKHFDIGADIEKIKDDFDVLDIAKNYFSELEIETLKKQSKEKQVEYFYRCWTRKESFIKAKAKGLSFPLDSFSVCINSDEKTELLETHWDEKEKDTWKLFTFSTSQNYIGAISVQGDVKSIEYFNFNNYNITP